LSPIQQNLYVILWIESVIELYEAGCVDYMFNFVLDSNKREEKLVTPILMNFDDNKNCDVLRKRRNVLGIHVFGDEKDGEILMILSWI